ncbi:FkbM family methyltransferase [Nocardia takedensis]
MKAAAGSGGLGWGRVHGGMWVAAPLDDYLGRAVYYVGENDRKITWVCRRLVRPGDIVLDIGANIGLVTFVLAALVGSTGEVHAYEPNPELCDLLDRARLRNRAEQVTVHRFALGAHSGTAALAIPQGHAGAASLTIRAAPDRLVDVPVRTLDETRGDFAEGDRRVRLVKIDVEGSEEDVIEGGRALLSSTSPPFAILFEFAQDIRGTNVDPRRHPLITELERLDYRFIAVPRNWVRMYGIRIDLENSTPADFTHDIVAVKAGADYDEACRLLDVRDARR